MKWFFVPCILILSTHLAAAQNKTDARETTFGNCSPNMSRNSGNVTIRCDHLDPAVAIQLTELIKSISLLSKKSASEKNQAAILEQLRKLTESVQAALKVPTSLVSGPVTQVSSGNCSPNIVGNNNTNVCGPQGLQIDSNQERRIKEQLLIDLPTVKVGKIELKIEVRSHSTRVAGEALSRSLIAADLDVDVANAYELTVYGDDYGGISFYNVSESALPFASSVAKALLLTGVVSGPVPLFMATPGATQTSGFSILVKSPD